MNLAEYDQPGIYYQSYLLGLESFNTSGILNRHLLVYPFME